MIANLANVLLGLWLSYLSVFWDAVGAVRAWTLAAIGAAMIVLALLASRSGYSGWWNATNTALGAILLALGLVDRFLPVPALVLFWIELWLGLTVATLALWALLYQRRSNTPGARQLNR